MAGMTVVERQAPHAGNLVAQAMRVFKATGAGTDSTEVLAAEAGKQHFVVGGFVSFDSAGEFGILSGATKDANIEMPAAGTQPLPPMNTARGEALNVQNIDGVTNALARIETITLAEGEEASLAG